MKENKSLDFYQKMLYCTFIVSVFYFPIRVGTCYVKWTFTCKVGFG